MGGYMIPDKANDVQESNPSRELVKDMPSLHYLTCEICGNTMDEQHCKIICKNCGYTRDCSDP